MTLGSWHVYGYGIRVDDIDTTPQKLMELAKKYPDVYNIVQEYLNKRNISEAEVSKLNVSIFDDLENEYGAHGVSWFLYETLDGGITFTYVTNYDGEEFIIMEPCLPWHYSTIEISLTEDDVKKVFMNCISVLTDQEIEITYKSIENGC